MDNMDKELFEIFNKEIHIPNEYEYRINSTLKKLNSKNSNIFIKFIEIISTIVAFIGLSSSFVFADEISNYVSNFYLTGFGVETAINSGYIQNNEESKYSSDEDTRIIDYTSEFITDRDTSFKVKDIVMDDMNLSCTISLKLTDDTLSKAKLDDIWDVHFLDLLITDENGNVIYANDFSKAEDYLNLKGGEVFESGKFCNLGFNTFIKKRKQNPVDVILNFYNEDTSNLIPKSKKLYFEFSKIQLVLNENKSRADKVCLVGQWKTEVEIPEFMYNRESKSYKVVESNTSKELDNISSFVVNNTNTIVELELKSRKQVNLVGMFFDKLNLDQYNQFSEEELNAIRNHINVIAYQSDTVKKCMEDNRNIWNMNDAYIENSKNEKFYLNEGPMPNGAGSIDDNNIFSTRRIFDFTTFNMTDKIKLHYKYLDREVEFELERSDLNENN